MVRCRPAWITLKTTVGPIQIQTLYGQDPADKRWINPVRQLWGLDAHTHMSPGLEDRLCFTAAVTGSYEMAAQVAGKWGLTVDDSTIHAHAQKAGERAGRLCQERTERALDPATRSQVVDEAAREIGQEKFSLVLMFDGWMARERGPQWGLKPPQAPGARVCWHEIKTGIIFRLEERAATQSGRRMVMRKYHVAVQGEPHEVGRRLHAEALRRGLAQARHVYVVADGSVWIWNIVQDRFSQATGVLDFYHASQHLWKVAHELHGEGEQATQWIEPMLHQLRHGGAVKVIHDLEELLPGLNAPESTEVISGEIEYFKTHAQHMAYEKVASQGCPCGSGAMESTCAQLQNRFKRTGQFWTNPGKTNLLELEIARRNGDWEDIWEKAA